LPVKKALLTEAGLIGQINGKITVELSDFVADNQSAEVFFCQGIPADDFQHSRRIALPAPVRAAALRFWFSGRCDLAPFPVARGAPAGSDASLEAPSGENGWRG